MREIKTIDCEKLDEELDQFIIDEKNLDKSASNEAKFHLLETLERQYLKITPNTSTTAAFAILDTLPIVAEQFSHHHRRPVAPEAIKDPSKYTRHTNCEHRNGGIWPLLFLH